MVKEGLPEALAAQSGPHREVGRARAVTSGCSEVSLHALLQLLEFLDKLLCFSVGAAFKHPQCRPHCRWTCRWA